MPADVPRSLERLVTLEFLESLQRVLEPYRHLDPLGWVGVYRALPASAGGALVALGVLLLLVGGGRLFRLVAAPLGALIAVLWTQTLAARLGYQALPVQVVPTVAVMLGLSGLLFPPLVMFFAFGLPAGFLAGQLAGDADWLLGFGPGLLAGGALGVALQRVVSALLSAAVGAWLAVLGGMALAAGSVPAVASLAANPPAVLVLGGCLALAGAVFQLAVRTSPRETSAQALKLKRARDHAEDDGRWTRYGKKT
jgi:hypothetical protein